jgi:sulfoxide reductase heme-binding subunit YedZ
MQGDASWRLHVHRWLQARWAGPALFTLGLLPLSWLILAAGTDRLGANPAEALIRLSGEWTLRFLCLTLAITPLRVTLRLPALARWRRMAGLFTAFYALMHLLSYAWLDMGLELGDIARDVAKRPFILVGMSAFAFMLPLAATSFNRAIQALGPARGRALHKAVFVTAALAILHFFWMRAAKNNLVDVGVYALVLATLVGWRILHALKARGAQRGGSP